MVTLLEIIKFERRIPKCGEVYYVRFEGDGSEQSGYRPAIVFQNNVGNLYSPNVIVLPLTTSLKKLRQPTHVLLPAAVTGIPKDSLVLCENPTCISKEKLGKYITKLPEVFMSKIAESYLLSTAALAYLSMDKIESVTERSNALNAA